MVIPLPATGTTIRMGGIYAAYTAGFLPAFATYVSLNAMLGVTKTGFVTSGARTGVSITFGNHTGPFNYV